MSFKFILFYSINCRFSTKFIEILQKFPEINSDFQKYPIESMNGNYPSGLTTVPTVLENETGHMYASQGAFDWLKNKIRNSFKPSNDITGKSDGGAEFSFINGIDETYLSGLFSSVDYNALKSEDNSVSAFDNNNGTKINPHNFDSNGKPIQQQQQQQQFAVQHSPQLTPSQFKQMNEQMNNTKNQIYGVNNNNNVPISLAVQQRQAMNVPNIQKNDQLFQQNVNQQINKQPISNQQFQQMNQMYNQQIGNNFNQGQGQAPPLPDALKPIDVSRQSANYNLDAVLQQRNSEVPQPPNRMGGGHGGGY